MSATYQGARPAGVNLLQGDSFAGASTSATLTIPSSDVPPYIAGVPVTKASNFGGPIPLAYNGPQLLAGQTYSGSVYIWLPSGYNASDCYLSLNDNTGASTARADLTKLNQWQRLVAPPLISLANSPSTFYIVADGANANTVLYATCGQVELGSAATTWQPGIGAQPVQPARFNPPSTPLNDIALGWNNAITTADIAMNGPDLLADDGLNTAIILSLLCDRVAAPGDILPDPNNTDRRGWWADAYLPPVGGKPDFIGSRLWLLKRAVQNNQTLVRAQAYAAEALQWLLDDGVAGALTITPSYTAIGRMLITVSLTQAGSQRSFDIYWSFS